MARRRKKVSSTEIISAMIIFSLLFSCSDGSSKRSSEKETETVQQEEEQESVRVGSDDSREAEQARNTSSEQETADPPEPIEYDTVPKLYVAELERGPWMDRLSILEQIYDDYNEVAEYKIIGYKIGRYEQEMACTAENEEGKRTSFSVFCNDNGLFLTLGYGQGYTGKREVVSDFLRILNPDYSEEDIYDTLDNVLGSTVEQNYEGIRFKMAGSRRNGDPGILNITIPQKVIIDIAY